MFETPFGQQLRSYYPEKHFPIHFTGMQMYHACMVTFWRDTLFKEVEKLGVKIF